MQNILQARPGGGSPAYRLEKIGASGSLPSKGEAMYKNRLPIRDPALCVLTAEPGLSLSAKGLAAFLLSRPPRPITRAELFRSNLDAMPFIDAAIRELEAVGMVERVPGRGRGRPRDTSGIQLRTPVAS